MWIIVGGFLIWLLLHAKQVQQVQNLNQEPLAPHLEPKSDTSNSGVINSVPPDPKVGTKIDTSYLSWYHPTDSIIPSDIVNARKMTIRQIQTAFKGIGASRLQVTGIWDLPTKQATWDFQYLHTNDNPDNPLNITGEFDQLTQNALQAKYTPVAQTADPHARYGFY